MLTKAELAKKIVATMEAKGFHIDRKPGECNVVYIEGMDMDGTPNANRHNAFDDVRMVIAFNKEGDPEIVGGPWEATTQPGNRYTFNPINSSGAAIIKLGYQCVWQTGAHRGQYEAWIQTGGEVTVLRDDKESFERAGLKEDTGWFGINQHHGGNAPRADIGGHSAGCLVGRMIDGHEEFMSITKADPRYKANGRVVMGATVMPAGWVLNTPVPERKPETHQPPQAEYGVMASLVVIMTTVGAFLDDHWIAISLACAGVVVGGIAYIALKKR
jgi:hypothetical protein